MIRHSWNRWRALFTALLFLVLFAPWFSSCGIQDPVSAGYSPAVTNGVQALLWALFYVIFPWQWQLRLPALLLAVGVSDILLYILMTFVTVTFYRHDPDRHWAIVPLAVSGLALTGLAAFFTIVTFFADGAPSPREISALLSEGLWGFWLTLLLIYAGLLIEIMDLLQTLHLREARRQASKGPSPPKSAA